MVAEQRSSFENIMRISLPIAFQSLVQSSLSVIDQMMVSRLGETAMAAAGLALRPMTILFFMFTGLTGALGVFSAQYYGDDKTNEIAAVLRLSARYGVAMLLPILIGTVFFPKAIMGVFSTDMEVIALGSDYLRIVALSFPMLFSSMMLGSVLKSCSITELSVRAGIVSVIGNTLLNFLLIYGIELPSGEVVLRWGLVGAAVATVSARLLEMSILFYGSRRYFKSGNALINRRLHISKIIKKRFFDVAMPLLISELVFVCSITFYAMIYGRMGTVQMAAMTVLYPIQNVAFGLFSGMSTASATLVGQALGNRKFNEAKELASLSLRMTFLMGLSLAVVIAINLEKYLELFHLQSAVYNEAHGLLLAALSVLPIQIMNMVIYEGVLRTGGETIHLVKIQFITLWAIGIPAGIITGIILKLPLPIVFYAVSFEELLRLILNFYLMNQEKWIANLT